MTSTLDYVIVGQGIAGTTLAWQLNWRGLRGLIVDRSEVVTSSRVAAGLMTPVTGKRFVPAWRFDEAWSAAVSFYRRVEAETGGQFFHQRSHVRLFECQDERENFAKRDVSKRGVQVTQPEPLIDGDCFSAPFDGFEMPMAGRLNVPSYLDASRQAFEQTGSYRVADFDPDSGMKVAAAAVELPQFNTRTRRLIFCQGYTSRSNRWFRDVRFEAARGEILTLRIEGLAETRIINRGVWLAPCGNGIFKAGSTYDTVNLDAGPAEQGREEIRERLQQFLKLPFEVVEHSSAVRPVVSGRQPIIGFHPNHPQIGIFNGLGSKGSLQAPLVASLFADALVDDAAVDPQLDVKHRFQTRSLDDATKTDSVRTPRLTEQAHAIVASVVKSGDTVIDATAGNGFDTCFLAEQVGTEGRVFAFDIQQQAIQRTADRLHKAGLSNVTLLQRDHSEMTEAIPKEHHRRVAAVMFNLGYLPGGDRSVITDSTSTTAAIRAALDLLRPGGIVTIIAYPGHSGGNDESATVRRLIETLAAGTYDVSIQYAASNSESAPRLWVVTRRLHLFV